ncbi:MAG: hypothetical protein IH784_09930, partial [Bacteroidetes bacterium]|nr:hypothetical protein [Bacteroidota bacterium]
LFEGELVSQAKEILIQSIPPPLEFIPDLDDDLVKSKIEGSILNEKKILEILHLAVTSRSLVKFISESREIAPILTQSFKSLFVDKLFEKGKVVITGPIIHYDRIVLIYDAKSESVMEWNIRLDQRNK